MLALLVVLVKMNVLLMLSLKVMFITLKKTPVLIAALAKAVAPAKQFKAKSKHFNISQNQNFNHKVHSFLGVRCGYFFQLRIIN